MRWTSRSLGWFVACGGAALGTYFGQPAVDSYQQSNTGGKLSRWEGDATSIGSARWTGVWPGIGCVFLDFEVRAVARYSAWHTSIWWQGNHQSHIGATLTPVPLHFELQQMSQGIE